MGEGVSVGPLVMVVEDHEDTRLMMRRMLELCGCGVAEAADGRQAVRLSRLLRPDLVLMDLNLPVLDGYAAALSIRRHRPTRDVPVVAVTAYDSPQSRAAARAVGCAEYAVKPLSLVNLAALLERLLPARAGRAAGRGAPAPAGEA